MIDYRKILKAYMDNVGEHEGVFFIGPIRPMMTDVLTEEEGHALADVYDELASDPSVSTWEEELERDRRRKAEWEAARPERERMSLEERIVAEDAEAQRIRATVIKSESP
jgi:hypothetical protein